MQCLPPSQAGGDARIHSMCNETTPSTDPVDSFGSMIQGLSHKSSSNISNMKPQPPLIKIWQISFTTVLSQVPLRAPKLLFPQLGSWASHPGMLFLLSQELMPCKSMFS